MPTLELLPWEAARAHAAPIRFAVFVEEQNVPAHIELDALDAASLHAVVFAEGRAIATGRLLPDGHIGRMAVLKAWRGRGIGGLLLERLVDEARRRGHREVVLAAQVHAAPFYRAHGFVEEGEEYLEAGIAHRDMRRPLDQSW
ncbi:MAG TPA: GNAT family N-acetyltransferase [Burkholderiales bacterium]|nr:GNAT family N-acetyltransferase [Burkholderiales bacterium]